jgi:hypothetical protein
MQAVGWEFKKARNFFTNILRDPNYDDASCLVLIAGLISIFLLQVEPLLWRRGIFRVLETYEGRWPSELVPLSGFWLLPFEWVSSGTKDRLWILVVIVYLANAVLIDRFVAKHSGSDVGFRSSILTLRRLLAGIPALGLCVIPAWRILWNRKPEWAYRRAAPRPVLIGGPPELEFLPGGAYLHSFPFILWILVSNSFALRAASAWLNEPERATTTGLLVVQGVCGGLRLGGLVLMVAYIHLRSREGDLWGRRKWGLLVCSGAWLLPQSLFILPIAALLFVGERWGAVLEGVGVQSAPEREVDQAIGSRFLDLRNLH